MESALEMIVSSLDSGSILYHVYIQYIGGSTVLYVPFDVQCQQRVTCCASAVPARLDDNCSTDGK